MTLPRKGSRRVRIGEDEYAWRIRKKSTYTQLAYGTPMIVAIQRLGFPKAGVLVVNLKVSRPDAWLHQTSVTPAVVRAIVARATANGWDPAAKGSFLFEYGLIQDCA